MDILEGIFTRRSIRQYQPTPVSDELLDKILAAGMAAPSAGNQQPWQFIIIRKRDLLDRIPSISPYADMVKQVSTAILVCGDLSLERFKGYWMQDCCAAVENILLAAHGVGLGAVWTAVYPESSRIEGFRELVGLPEHVIPLALVPIGYPNTPPGSVNRFNRTRIHYDKWKNFERSE